MPKVTQLARDRDLNLGQSDFKTSVLSTASCCYREFAFFFLKSKWSFIETKG